MRPFLARRRLMLVSLLSAIVGGLVTHYGYGPVYEAEAYLFVDRGERNALTLLFGREFAASVVKEAAADEPQQVHFDVLARRFMPALVIIPVQPDVYGVVGSSLNRQTAAKLANTAVDRFWSQAPERFIHSVMFQEFLKAGGRVAAEARAAIEAPTRERQEQLLGELPQKYPHLKVHEYRGSASMFLIRSAPTPAARPSHGALVALSAFSCGAAPLILAAVVCVIRTSMQRKKLCLEMSSLLAMMALCCLGLGWYVAFRAVLS